MYGFALYQSEVIGPRVCTPYQSGFIRSWVYTPYHRESDVCIWVGACNFYAKLDKLVTTKTCVFPIHFSSVGDLNYPSLFQKLHTKHHIHSTFRPSRLTTPRHLVE